MRIDAAILDFLTPAAALAADELFHEPAGTGDIQRRLDGARQVRQFAVQHRRWRVLSAMVTLIGAVVLMLILQRRGSRWRLPRDHAALCSA